MTVMTPKHASRRLADITARGGKWQAWALVRDNPVLPVIAAIGFAVSFQTIAGLAKTQHMPGWPVLYPVLIDVFLLGVIIEARKASDDGRSDVVPRVIAWALAAFTVYVNAHGAPAGELARHHFACRSAGRVDHVPGADPVAEAAPFRVPP